METDETKVSHHFPQQKALSNQKQTDEDPMTAITKQFSTEDSSINFDLTEWENRLKETPNLTLPLEEELMILHQLSQFEFGRFLLKNKELNGYWTSYMIRGDSEQQYDNPLEEWIIHKGPIVRATRERFKIFQEEIQKRLKAGMRMASIPCGSMDDLLSLDYNSIIDVQLVGFDIDQESLQIAELNATKCPLGVTASFSQKDAWNLAVSEEYDLVTSNGLNIYEPDEEKVILLYKEFYKALRPAGVLITSFMTPPPILSTESSWKGFDFAAVIKQKAISVDILQGKWHSYRTEAKTRQHLEAAGFRISDIIYDLQGMFPTVIAEK
jgi:SAM-dependent methyltransferase